MWEALDSIPCQKEGRREGGRKDFVDKRFHYVKKI
jgi:hypothetical protein